MSDLVTRLRLDNSEFNSNIDDSKKKVKGLQDTSEAAGKSLNNMGKNGAKSAKELLSEMSKIEGASRSTSNYRMQLSKLQRDIQDLTINYRNMTDEMKNSDLGHEVQDKIQELTAKASEYKDALLDAQQSVKVLASDTAAWDGVKQGIDTASAALQGFVAMGVLGEDSTEKLVKVIAQLKSIEAATNTVIKVGNALQKQSALMMSVSAVQSKALAKAKQLEEAATGKATIAQRLFNAVAKANPYVLLAAAVIAVVSALAAFAIKADKAKQEQEELTKAHEDYMNKMKDSISKMGEAAYSFDTLKKKYEECRTEAEKQKFLEDYKDKLNDLGISVNNINGLEDVFIKRTEDFRRACILRAQAMGLETMQADNYKEMMSEIMAARDLLASRKGTRINEGDPLFDMLKKYNVGQYVARWGKDYVTATDEVFEGLEQAIRDHYSGLSKQIDDEQKGLEKQVADLDLGDAFNFNSKGNSGTNKTTNEIKKQGKEVQQEIKNQINLLEDEKKKLQEQIPAVEHLGEKHKEILERIKEIDAQVNKLKEDEQAWLKSLERKPLEKVDAVSPINTPLATTKPQTIKVRPVLDNEGKAQLYRDAQNLASKLKNYVDLGLMDTDVAKKLIDNINSSLEEQGIKAKIGVEFDTESVNNGLAELSKKIGDFTSTASGILSPINTIYETIKGLNESVSEAKNGWESFFAVFQAGMTIMDSVASLIQTISTVTTIFKGATEASSAATAKDTIVTQANAAASGEAAAAKLSEAAAEGAVAAAEGGASVAKIPYVGGFIAAGIIGIIMGAIIASLSKAQSFATGGIVGGGSFVGDKVLARVNSGEMVLNKEQQTNLFKMLNEGKQETKSQVGGGEVEFRIKGTELVGVLNNINKRNSMI